MLRRFSYFCALRPPWPPLTGYLANWKMLEPRKLMPLSIEVCSAPIAVITEITENTPIVMPTIVSPERSLFAPNDCIAMEMISRNCMAYSYRSAVTGSKREADQAGAKPETNPVKMETNIPISTRPNENWTGNEGKAVAMAKHIA